MSFNVNEIFYSLQGEGHHTGRPAVFCRFSGCNLWTGQDVDRTKAICQFCDTNFITAAESGGTFETASELITAILSYFPDYKNQDYKPYVILTGGEPALQITQELISGLKENGLEVGIETNGTKPLPKDIDWVTVSPKAGTKLAITSGNELKLVWPQESILLADFEDLNFEHLYIQPRGGADSSKSTELAIEICLKNPVWKLSLQTHKLIGIQ
ncbi:7-carboxy-7-deazaguanine synthase [Maridesulfovibrio frigidus]|uniref:7-carboxy-7-deazaguanine synthase n=1 Tax=Maridesulfovibrio frigidus TaxID=340956 RepID=UPI0004E136E9|nr:7-carboxy-7-deazaguanine synthase [Maridesulfovibrio frigidus]